MEDIFNKYLANFNPDIFPDKLKNNKQDVVVIHESQSILNQLEVEKRPVVKPTRKRKVIFDRHVEPVSNTKGKTTHLPIKPFTQQFRVEQEKLFLNRLIKINATSVNPNNLLPPQTDVLRYIKNLDDAEQPPWIKTEHNRMLSSNTKYPVHPILSRPYIENFLRQACDKERNCNKLKCKSLKYYGFKCRELLMPDEIKFSVIPGWCYICHLHKTTKYYLQELNMDNEKIPYSIHCFIVHTDKIGEYKLNKTIQGTAHTRGIFGPVPWFNRNNYVAINDGIKRLNENDSLLFRLTQEVSNLTVCSNTTRMETANA